MDAVLEVPIPSGMSEGQVRNLREEVAVYLFSRGCLSTHEAAEWLGMPYEEFRDLAAQRGTPTVHFNEEDARREMRRLGIAP